MVLMHQGGFELTAGGMCHFVVGQKDSLSVAGKMQVGTYGVSWEESQRRTWCNDTYRNASSISSIFKAFNVTTATKEDGVGSITTDYFALPAEKEIFGTISNSDATAEGNLFQFDWYKAEPNRVKKILGEAYWWWQRSRMMGDRNAFCCTSASGGVNYNNSQTPCGIAPFGCI